MPFKFLDRILPIILFSLAATFCWLLLDSMGILKELLTASELKLLGAFSISITAIITGILTPDYLKHFRQGDHLWFGMRSGITITYLSFLITAVSAGLWTSLSNNLKGVSIGAKLLDIIPFTIIILLTGVVLTSVLALPVGILCGHILWRYSVITSHQAQE